MNLFNHISRIYRVASICSKHNFQHFGLRLAHYRFNRQQQRCGNFLENE